MHAVRENVSVESFINEFDGEPYGRLVLEVAYDDLSKLSRLPIRREDDLEKTLGFLPEDFEQMLEARCRKLGLANVWKSSHAHLFPLKTAGDYVQFLSTVMGEQSKPKPTESG